jgi:hypothetical protein
VRRQKKFEKTWTLGKNENATSERISDHYSKTVVLFDHDKNKNFALLFQDKCLLISKGKFSFAPKNEWKYFCISALASKKR